MFKRCSNSIVKELNIPIDQNLIKDGSIFDYFIIAAVHKYERHPSILEIKEKVKKYDLFSFYHVNHPKTSKILQNMDQIRLLRLLGLPNKTTQQSDIPVRIIKENKFTFSKILSEILNIYI